MRMNDFFWPRRSLIVSLALALFSLSAPAALASICELELAPRERSLRFPFTSFRESLPVLISRVKPIYQDARFNVRVVSSRLTGHAFSPVALEDRVVRDVDSTIFMFTELGFQPESFIQVLVEADPGALKPTAKISDGCWVAAEVASAFWAPSGWHFQVPGLFGGQRRFGGREGFAGFPSRPSFIVLPALSNSYHVVQNKFAAAHEIAHATENADSHQDLMWREGRADFLAYVATGIADVYHLIKDDLTLVRSLKEPTVPSVDDIVPKLGAYHLNSQVISSLLYEIARSIGIRHALAFVKWMDDRRHTDLLPDLIPLSQYTEDLNWVPMTRFLDDRDPIAVRRALAMQLRKVGDLMRLWMKKYSQLTTAERDTIAKAMAKRGLVDSRSTFPY